MRPRLQIPVVGGVVLVALLLLRAWDPAALQVLRHRSFDIYQRVAPLHGVEAPVAIVAIDDVSLAVHGQWPWPRTLIADLVAALKRAGAASIAFEIVWPEPDRVSPENVIRSLRGLDPAIEDRLRAMPSHDAMLAASFADARVVLGRTHTAGANARTGTGPKATYVHKGADPVTFQDRVVGWAPNLEGLEAAAAGVGALTLGLDADGVLRRPSLLIASDDGTYPVLALEALRVALSQPSIVTFADERGLAGVRVGQIMVPVGRRGRAWLYAAPHRDDWFVSAASVLAGQADPARFKGRIVFVGLSASGLQQVRPTAVADLSTTEIQAQLAAGMITGTLLQRPLWSDRAEFGAIAGAGLLVIAGVAMFGAMGGLALGVVALGGIVGGSWTLFDHARLLIDASYPAAATVALYLMLTVVGYVRERRQRQQVRGAFAQYLSPALVQRLADNPGALRIGGEMKTMTVLFSDIRGFTGIAERLSGDPEGLTRLINLYFTAMSDRLLEYGATIDKYMGDAVMAFWNAPLDDPDHARNACRAALEMLDGLAKLNRKLAQTGTGIALDIGIGINSGECLVGNIGSEHRFNYSVIGDAVNLAARLETETKAHGARIAVGAATRALAPDFAYLELGTIRARGRSETTTIHALLGPPDLAGTPGLAALAAAQDQFLAAYRACDWGAARVALDAVRAAGTIAPAALDIDRLCAAYAGRLDALAAAPPVPGWDGVYPSA